MVEICRWMESEDTTDDDHPELYWTCTVHNDKTEYRKPPLVCNAVLLEEITRLQETIKAAMSMKGDTAWPKAKDILRKALTSMLPTDEAPAPPRR